MADYTPIYSGGVNPFTATTSAAVTAGRVLKVSADGTVAHATINTDTTCLGVAASDAGSGAKVTVWPLANCIHELTTLATVTAGDGIVAAAGGAVATAPTSTATAAAAGTLIGIATTTRTGAGTVRVMGRY